MLWNWQRKRKDTFTKLRRLGPLQERYARKRDRRPGMMIDSAWSGNLALSRTSIQAQDPLAYRPTVLLTSKGGLMQRRPPPGLSIASHLSLQKIENIQQDSSPCIGLFLGRHSQMITVMQQDPTRLLCRVGPSCASRPSPLTKGTGIWITTLIIMLHHVPIQPHQFLPLGQRRGTMLTC